MYLDAKVVVNTWEAMGNENSDQIDIWKANKVCLKKTLNFWDNGIFL